MTQNNNKADLDYGAIPVMDAIAGPGSILDQKDPLVLERERADRRKKIGVAALLTVVLVGLTAVVGIVSSDDAQGQSLKTLLDRRFASLLVDEKAFFFPSAAGSQGRRSLGASDEPTNPWGLAWADNKDSYAAVGAYYRAKGKALKHYYKSMYDPLYNKTAEEAGVANITLDEAAPWAFDWKKDPEAGMDVGSKYNAIGELIDDHYMQAFAPEMAAEQAKENDGTARRFLRVLVETAVPDDEEEEAAPIPAFDWAADRDRGIAIGEHFKALGQQIKEHYEQPFDETTGAPVDWSTTWMDFKTRGEAVGKYYHDKGVAIARFYEQQDASGQGPEVNDKVSLAGVRSASIAGGPSSDSDDSAAENAKNDWYIWGMDWKNDKEGAMQLHEDMKAKGQAIANYYRAKFDPAFFANAAEMVSNSLDNLSFPTWGEDAESDKAHGKAIGEYWAAHGKKELGKEQPGLMAGAASSSDEGSDTSRANYWMEQGETWKERGRSTGKFWEDFYRSKFDPTYDSSKDADW